MNFMPGRLVVSMCRYNNSARKTQFAQCAAVNKLGRRLEYATVGNYVLAGWLATSVIFR